MPVFVLGPKSFGLELLGAAESRQLEIAPLPYANVVVSDVTSFSSMSATDRRQLLEGRIGIVASEQLDPGLILRSHLDGWLAVAQHQLSSVMDAGVEALDPRSRLLMLLDRQRRGLPTIALADGEWGILQTLVSSWGVCVTATDLAEVAMTRSDSAAVTLVWKYISRLRARLASWSVAIESVPGKGYRVVRGR